MSLCVLVGHTCTLSQLGFALGELGAGQYISMLRGQEYVCVKMGVAGAQNDK